jgi:ClpX C4-type zinc finger
MDAQAPPPTLDSIRVLVYAVLKPDMELSGRSMLFVDRKELGRVPRLVVGQQFGEADYLLCYCDDSWSVLGVSGHVSIAEAQVRAERAYPGVSGLWQDSPYKFEEAARHYDAQFENRSCSFCGRKPHEVGLMIDGRDSAAICELCIASLAKRPTGPECSH